MPRIASTKPGLALLALVVVLGVLGARRTGSSAAHVAHGVPTVTSRPGQTAARPAPVLAVVPDAEPAADATLRLEGQVLDAREQPVGGALVTLGGNRSVTSEADGSFAFDDLAEGSYDLTAVHEGAFAEVQGAGLDATSDPVTLTLVRGPTLVVHVVDEHGQPIAGAKVEVDARAFVTDAAGSVRIRGVDPDGVYVAASSEGRARRRNREPTSEDPNATVECTIVLPAASQVTGVVLDEAGQPVGDAWVQLADGTGSLEVTTSEADGTWVISDLPSGDYTAYASSRRHISGGALAIAHDASRPTTGVVLRLKHGAEITGVVVDDAGHPLVGADVTTLNHSDVTNERGEFVLQGLDADTYTVSATTKTQGAPNQLVDLTHAEHARVTFVLASSSLAGRVVDSRGEPVDNAMVYARSDALGVYTIEHSDPYGHFDLGGLAPGQYTVTAQRPGSRIEGPELEVTTTNRHLELRVPEVAAITGRVTMHGVPVPHYRLSITADQHRERPMAVYNPVGRFLERDVAPGTYEVSISGTGLARRVVSGVTLSAGEVRDLGDLEITAADESP